MSWPLLESVCLPSAALFCGDLFVGFHRLMPMVLLKFRHQCLDWNCIQESADTAPAVRGYVSWRLAILPDHELRRLENAIYHLSAFFRGSHRVLHRGSPFFLETLLPVNALYALVFFGGSACWNA